MAGINTSLGLTPWNVAYKSGNPAVKGPDAPANLSQEKQVENVKARILQNAVKYGFTIKVIDQCVEARIFDKMGRQVGVIYYFGNDRSRLAFKLDNPLLIEEMKNIIHQNPALISTENNWPSHTEHEFNFYPKLTQEEIAVLTIKPEVAGGFKIILQGEFAVATAAEKIQIGTYGIGPCRGFLIYDPVLKIAALGHCDMEGADLDMLEAMRQSIIKKGADPKRLIFIGTDNIDPMAQQYGFAQFGFQKISFNLLRDFVFNPDTLTISPIRALDIPHANNEELRLQKKTDIRLKHRIPWIE